MEQDQAVERFRQLSQRYDTLHQSGAWLRLKDNLGLGSGPFNDELTTKELEELNKELEVRLSRTTT